MGAMTPPSRKSCYNFRVIEINRVLDGDTIDVTIDLGFDLYKKERVRVAGVDTPEKRTRDLEEKEVLVKTIWLSLDPYMRGTMNRIDEGEVMIGEIIGEVIRSNSENYNVGEIVLSKSGWQMFSIADESTLKKVDSLSHNLF